MRAIDAALHEYGLAAIPGDVDNAEVVKYFTEINATWVKDDDTAWCAAFVNWCLMKARQKYSSALNARSFMSYGIETNDPVLGDLVVLWRISRDSVYGHVGFFVTQKGEHVYILGGNQSGEVNVKRFPKYQVLGYRAIPY